MPLQATSGAASYDAFGGGAPAAGPQYIEDVFSPYLVLGNGSAPAVNNGIDLSTKGGLVWTKKRNAAGSHSLFDTARGANLRLISNDTAAEDSVDLSFTTTGFSNYTFDSAVTYATWTLRNQPKFFQCLTYTGNGSGNRIITSSLGSPIGCVFIKRTDSTSNWAVAHRKDGSAVATGLNLNTTAAALYPNSTNDTFDATGGFNAGYIVDSSGNSFNVNGASYVAYLFAHNAGGFGLTGSDNVISCGSFTTTAGGAYSEVSLGYEPQWVLIKTTSTTNDWMLFDNMRGMTASLGGGALLTPNSSAQEFGGYSRVIPTATGFYGASGLNASANYIYIAIRRGPMKVPTLGTTVFSPVAQTNTGSQPFPVTAGFPVDSAWFGQRNGWGVNFITSDRLRGATNLLITTITGSESANNSTYGPSVSKLDSNTQFFDGMTNASEPDIYWMFKRAPGYFDEVCYTGTGTAGQTYTHNLGVAPEFMIVKNRTTASQWLIYQNSLGNTQYLLFTTAASASGSFAWNNTSPTSSVFSVGTSGACNTAGENYVAYLFATCAGVSKVGSYTGNGSSQTINCGFTGGARFVMVKATSTTGNWIVADSARGIVAGNDPALYLNSTAAEVTGLDWIDADNSGFVVNETATIAANTNGVSYIFLAIS
jgi:hypothetical protein